jgi:hypothetical protein
MTPVPITVSPTVTQVQGGNISAAARAMGSSRRKFDRLDGEDG